MSGTDRIFSFTSSSRSRLPVLLEPIKRSYRKSYGVRRDLIGYGMIFALLAALAVLVKHERKLSRWLKKSPRRRRRKAVGLKKPALL